ncbi:MULTISPECIES: leucine-rich repeat domain-containing protein [unclassified Treponema]|uniref:leucine-rich repeat domain-containing protein n=1 Tax=unclassified Treponema TaxID=2638727 RepID=UPI0020A523E4|nr:MULTISPECIES: hypothetical protein [unclassified Treponema]UTC66837.1 leucine-rich repeat domain-containing protein [Treponema sp. OMZ 789]UTC69568.1 leucine-rich repeat domain-containing protein [Treponema sp. OMZ 790]UTC72282.1 leucine-rich repeat domain-containing protein [Treponema sp. OMZ 791]
MKKLLMTVLLTAGLLIGTVNAEEAYKTGAAILGISPDTNEIVVKALTADGSEIQVEGCTVEELPSGESVRLTATGNWIVLKGAITELYCSGNRLTSLDVRGLQDLTVLECAGNDLTSLDVRGLTALAVLDCSENQLASLNVQGLTVLRKLNCSRTLLTALNLRGLTALRKLDCFNTLLTSLNVQDLTALEELNCSGNKLNSLNMQGLTALKVLYCSDNGLTALNVQGLTALEKLYCTENQLTSLNVQGLSDLVFLNCAENQLNEEAFIRIFNNLPDRGGNEAGRAFIYREKNNPQEKNITDLTSSAKLITAFEAAKAKNWIFYKRDTNGNDKKI